MAQQRYAISTSAWRRILPMIRQYEATTGRAISPNRLRALLEAEYSQQYTANQQQFNIAANLKLGQEQLALRRKQFEAENEAAGVGGITQLALAGKELGLGKYLKQGAKAIKSAFSGISTTDVGGGLEHATSAISRGATQTAGGIRNAAQAAALAPGTISAANAATYPGTNIITSATSAGVTPEAAEAAYTSLGATAPTTVGSQIASAALPVLAGAGLGAGIAPALENTAFGKITPWQGKKTSAIVGGAIGGGIAGSIAIGGTFGGPIGAVVGAVVGVVSGNSIICSELHRQGLLDDEVLKWDHAYRIQTISPDVYAGYLNLANPIVKRMKRSKRFTRLVALFAVPTAKEMAHRANASIKGSVLGKIVLALGLPLCKLAAPKEVNNGEFASCNR